MPNFLNSYLAFFIFLFLCDTMLFELGVPNFGPKSMTKFHVKTNLTRFSMSFPYTPRT